VYVRAGGETTLVSTGPDGGNGEFEAFFRDDSADGTVVVFETDESLVSTDTDTEPDLYMRAGGQTTLVSTGPAGGNADTDVEFEDASADAGRVFFTTVESLVSADTDTRLDIYEHANGQTTLLSSAPNAGNADFNALFRGASEDGSHVFFETQESLLSSDADAANDIYGKRIAAPDKAPPTAPGSGATPPAPSEQARGLPGACTNATSGTAAADRLMGGDFGDRLLGRAGDDVLIGREGDDCLAGGRGDDWLGGSLGDDRLAGDGGDDTLKGGRGRDVLVGGRGNDRIYSLDGQRDTVRCGKGADDRVRVDRRDRVIGCEQVTRVGG
jgi:Ca2+-binding RTX toxin-like protein